MKHVCPHCKAPGIKGLAKRWSGRATPAECSVCGGLSHVLASTNSGIWIAGIVIFMGSLIGALVLHSGLLFASGVVLVVAFNVLAWRRAKLYPISRESAGNAARAGWFVAGACAFIALFR